jgi:glycosyltransferase involved in cell wall biosynthesis
MQVLVAQLGPRMYYAVPRILHEAGLLSKLHTDFYVGRAPWSLLFRASIAKALPRVVATLGARNARIPCDKVIAFQRFGLEYICRLKRSSNPNHSILTNLWAGAKFNELSVRHGLGDADVVYGFQSASLGLFEHCTKLGIKKILEQTIAPRMIEHSILSQEHERWPGWEDSPSSEAVAQFAQREAYEWDLSDMVLCPSEFVKSGLEQLGVPREKCRIVPYGVPLADHDLSMSNGDTAPLRVLFVGQVGLRKGIPYLLDAVRQFKDRELTCRIVGPIGIALRKLHSYIPGNVQLVGSVPRSRIDEHFGWANVLCLPSLCEGSATVIYEALVRGLSVITTPNSGSILPATNNHLIVPIRDPEAIATALRQIAQRKENMDSTAIRQIKEQASIDGYAQRLIAAIRTV